MNRPHVLLRRFNRYLFELRYVFKSAPGHIVVHAFGVEIDHGLRRTAYRLFLLIRSQCPDIFHLFPYLSVSGVEFSEYPFAYRR